MSYYNVELMHNRLNEIYSLSENIFEEIKIELPLITSYDLIKGNYIKINEKYEYQKYPLPIVTVKDKGDIGFDINGVWFEFFLDKNNITVDLLENLKSKYKFEMYSGFDCLIDFYTEGRTIADVIYAVNNSKDKTIGISVYLDTTQMIDIKKNFFKKCE